MKNLSGKANYLDATHPLKEKVKNEEIKEPLTEDDINDVKYSYDKLIFQCEEMYKKRTTKEIYDLNIGLHRVKDIIKSLTV